MATLYFKIGADYENVIRLRDEIKKLENQLRSFGKSTPETQIRQTEERLASTRQEFMRLTTEAAKAGAAMENDFKKKIFDASQVVNDFSSQITKQRGVIHQLQSDLSRIKDRYRETAKSGGDASELSEQIKAASSRLREQKDVLFNLTQEQANARLSVKKLRDEYALFKKDGGETEDVINKITGSMRNWAVTIAGGMGLKEFIGQVINVRGEMQQLNAAFTTLLGSSERADALMSQLIETAATTPFNLTDVANGARQLLAYGLEAEEVNETLIRLGDIAAGLSIPLNDLAWLYGTTMTQGRMYAQDLNQFLGRGIPMLDELAKVMGVAKDEVRELVSAGKVGFPEVQEAIENLTGEGSQFGGLMEMQSKTITGQISNIEDSIVQMFNSIGQQSESIINNSLSVVSYLIEHYEEVGRVLVGLISTYGVYKTAVMVVTTLQKLQAAGIGALTAAEAIHYGWLVVIEKAQRLLNDTMLSNPYVLAATAIAGLVAITLSLKDADDQLIEANERYEEQKQKTIEAEEQHKRKIEELLQVAENESLATDTRREALYKLEQKYPDIFAKYNTEYDILKDIKQIKEEIAQLDAENSISNPEVELRQVQDHLYQLYKGRGTARADIVEPQIKMLQQREKELMELIRKNDINEYFDNLGGVDDETIERLIKQRENLIARMTTGNKDFGRISKGDERLRGDFSRDELQHQLNKLQQEQNRRSMETANSTEWVEKLRKNYEEAQKAYDNFMKSTSNQLNQQDFEKEAKRLKDVADTAKKEYNRYKVSSSTTTRKTTSNEEKEARQRLETEKRLGEELVALRRSNEEAEVEAMQEGLQKRLAQIELNYKREKEAIANQAASFKAGNEATGATGLDAGGLTMEQRAELAAWSGRIENQRQQSTEEAYRADENAMDEYLAKYGTFLEKKQALERIYSRKMATANDVEKLSFQKELEEAVSSLDLDKLKKEINWQLIFGDLSRVSKDELEKVKGQLEDFLESGEYKTMTVDQKKVVDEALANIESAMVENGGLLGGLPEQLAELRDAQKELAEAQEEYNQALENGTEKQQEEALEKRNAAQNKLAVAERNVSTASSAAMQNISSLGKVIAELGSNSEMSVAQMGGMVENVASMFGELGSKVGGIIGAAMSLIGAISEQGLGNFLKNLDKLGNDLARETMEFFTFGLIDFGGESDETLKEDLEQLTLSNESLEAAINRLAEKMEEASVADASAIYEQQKAYLEESMANTQEMMQRSGAAYSTGFLGMGGDHSSNYEIDEGMSAVDWGRISKIVGRRIDSAADFWGLSSEEMAAVADEANDLYSKIKGLASDGHEDAGQYMDEYIEYYRELQELQDAWYEKLTSVSFDSVRDDFKNCLLDMEADAEDFASNFEEMMKNAIVESLMTSKYDPLLKVWYENFAEAMEDGKMTKDEQEALKADWDNYVNMGLADREVLADIFGWGEAAKEQQTASRGGFETMTQDQASELSGRFTAVAETGVRIEGAITSLKGDLSGLLAQSQGIYSIADDTRNILAQSYLELQQINENTAAIIVPIQKMQKDIEQVKQNTARL